MRAAPAGTLTVSFAFAADAIAAAEVADKLIKYTKLDGSVSANKDPNFPFGPYLVAIPPAPVGVHAGNNTILIDPTPNDPPAPNESTVAGWVYNPQTGQIIVNSTGTDESGKAYKDY